MEHARFTLAALEVSGDDVPLTVGDLLVVRHDGADELDWELVATSSPVEPYAGEPHQLVMAVLGGGRTRTLVGDAVVVRSDEQRHVFRGVGPLDGLMAGDLPPEGHHAERHTS